MSATEVLLAAIRHGDSFFPTGTIAFSWGLETLRTEGAIGSAADIKRFVDGQLRCRWATCDRAALVAAYRCADDLDRVAAIDAELDAMSLAREMREGSRRLGVALLEIHRKLGTAAATEYRELVRSRSAPGHAAAVQGLLWRGVGLDEAAAQAVSAHTFCVGLVGAALRLGVIGHVDGQRILAGVQPVICALLAEPPPGPEGMSACTLAAEIAMMRHETASARMFSN